MIIIRRKKGESFDRMLRRYKRKHRDLKIKREVMGKKYYTKPSTKRREELLKAEYISKKQSEYES